jgi:hypothetical protein
MKLALQIVCVKLPGPAIVPTLSAQYTDGSVGTYTSEFEGPGGSQAFELALSEVSPNWVRSPNGTINTNPPGVAASLRIAAPCSYRSVRLDNVTAAYI